MNLIKIDEIMENPTLNQDEKMALIQKICKK